MANEVLRLPSGIEMVMALLRYITRSAVKLNRAEITAQLLAYLPKEWRFPLAPAVQQSYAQQVARIDNLEHLLQLVNQLLTSQSIGEFDQALLPYLPPDEGRQ